MSKRHLTISSLPPVLARACEGFLIASNKRWGNHGGMANIFTAPLLLLYLYVSFGGSGFRQALIRGVCSFLTAFWHCIVSVPERVLLLAYDEA
jgi:hypothetical protein